MKPIETDIYEPVPDSPGHVRVTGQRSAQEVFAELKRRLDSVGYLPDEYFMMDSEWQNGTLLPANADFFCTADYGGNEGVYLDIYVKWREDDKSITKSFATGKTLDESGDALDRMHLTASAVMKAFHGDGSSHERYTKLVGADAPTGMVVHLNAGEHRAMVDALVAQRNAIKAEFNSVEKLLRRVTGSVTEFVNEIGERPLKLTDYDRAVLSINDGNLDEFYNAYLCVDDENVGELLIHAAGRAGTVGRQMTLMMLGEDAKFTNGDYHTACRKAVITGDALRVELLMHNAERRAPDLDAAFYGEVIRHAYNNNHRNIAKMLITSATHAQIAAAPPELLYAAASHGDFSTMSALTDKGISAGHLAESIAGVLTANRNEWMRDMLIEKGVLSAQEMQSAEPGNGVEIIMGITKITLDELREMTETNGFILQNCVGDPQKRVDAINETLTEKGVLRNGEVFVNVPMLTHNGATNLLFFMDGLSASSADITAWVHETRSTVEGMMLNDFREKMFGIPVPVSEQRSKPECPIIGADGNYSETVIIPTLEL